MEVREKRQVARLGTGKKMHEAQMHCWKHEHTFGTQAVPRGESRTRWVIGLTVAAELLLGAG